MSDATHDNGAYDKSPTRDLSDLLDGVKYGARAGIAMATAAVRDLLNHDAGLDPDNAQPFDLGWNAALEAAIELLSTPDRDDDHAR